MSARINALRYLAVRHYKDARGAGRFDEDCDADVDSFLDWLEKNDPAEFDRMANVPPGYRLQPVAEFDAIRSILIECEGELSRDIPELRAAVRALIAKSK